MKKFRLILCLLLVAALLFGMCAFAATAAGNSITYNWQGRNAYDAGFAQGTITVNADSSSGGAYTLYWADDNAALDGYEPVCVLNVSNSGSASFVMPENTAIPAKATRLIGFRNLNSTDLSVSNATVNYKLPSDKVPGKTDADLLYSFEAISDTHISSNEEGSSTHYPFDEEHLADAFRTAAARDVDFIVTTGDHVNNQRADNKGGSNPFYPEEWNTYLRILAESDYVNPIYEAVGNHELWCYDTESNYSGKDWRTGSNYFCQMTGLDSTAATLNSGKAYYEITEPVTGDHFLFMALEGGFYTDRVDEFSSEQLTWLESKLSTYENDGKNVFIMEHANFDKWGAGDQIDNPAYDLPLKDSSTTTVRLKALLQRYKNAVVITGHTHFRFSQQLNYSNNERTSATIIHNSSVGAVRYIEGVNTRKNDASRENTEGYIVEVYRNATIFCGTNLYTNKIIPSATYLVPQNTSPIVEPTEAPTDPPTEAPTEALTEAPTQAPTEAPTESPTQAPEPEIIYGDADDDGEISILDVTFIQRYDVGIRLPYAINLLNADVDDDGEVNILDATYIQRWLVGVIHSFPAEGIAAVGSDKDIADTGADVEFVEEAAGDLNTLRSQAKTALDKYWSLASYDQYQALKKAYKQNAGYDELNAAYTAFSSAANSFYSGDSIDVYFSNNRGWSTVYAYCSAGHGKDKNASWPGQQMTYVTTNSYGEKIYKINVPTAKYNFIIFNNNSEQTVDLPLGITKNQGFYYDSNLGKDSNNYLRCSSYVYK